MLKKLSNFRLSDLGKWNKHKYEISVLVILIALFAFSAIFLNAQEVKASDTDVSGLDKTRSQVLVTGQDYKIDKDQEEIRDKEQRDFEKAQTEKEDNELNSQNRRMAQGENGDDPTNGGKTPGSDEGTENGDNKEDPAEPEKEDTTLPTIKTDLKQNQKVSGTYKSFYVKATDYKGQYISAYNLDVDVNGEKQSSTSDNGSKVTYRADLNDGANTITIKATDNYGKSKTVTYRIYGDSSGSSEEEGTITFSVEATTLGLGHIVAPQKTTVYSGEQVSYFFDRIMKDKGLGYTNDGSLKNGFYLKRVNKSGVTNGYKVPDKLMSKLAEVGFDTLGEYQQDSLGENDFTKGAGWMCQINGEYQSVGLSSYMPKDGDEIRFRFTLWYGYDIGDGKGSNDWGDW